MNDANPRQQIVDSIKNNSNILVTVSTSPSVDELSAALGLTILLNNLNKRATAVVSGKIPPAITFLDPEKTFEDTVDSLRDFIIALDKEKADHLRYKVDGDVVKIFITPYRTTLTEKDLEFTQGDYNVELVIALGVKDKDHLDKALDAHGRILHDAVVATITAGEASSLGSIGWQDPAASSLCEMLVSLTEALKDDKPVLDEQIATALLTGIVSATDRFSNDRTSSRIMTMAAQLMAAGANQQLIAAKLEEAHDIAPETPVAPEPETKAANADGTTSLAEGESTKLGGGRKKKKEKQPADGIDIAHEEGKKPKEEAKPKDEKSKPEKAPAVPAPALPVVEPLMDQPPAEDIEQKLAAELGQLTPPEPQAPPADLGQQLEEAKNEETSPTQATEPAMPPLPPLPPIGAPTGTEESQPPAFDFEALLPKTPQPTADAPPVMPPVPPADLATSPTADISSTHADNNYVTGNAPSAPLNGIASEAEPPAVDPFSKPLVSPSLPPLQPDPLFDAQRQDSVPATAATIQPPSDTSGMPDFEETPIPNDPAAVAAVPDFAAMNPTGLAGDGNAPSAPALPSLDAVPPPPPLPDFSNLPPLPPVPNLDPIAPAAPAAPEKLEDMFPPGQAVPPPASPPPAPSAPPPPGQFKIPGQ